MDEIKTEHNSHEGETMNYAPTTGNIPLTAPVSDYAGLFGGGSADVNYVQNEFTRRDIADHNLSNVMGQGELKDAIQNQTLLDTIMSNRDTASINASIAGQSAMFESRLNGLENQATLRREIDCQTSKILMGQELQTQKILLDAYQNPKPTSTLTVDTCNSNSGITVGDIQVAIGQGIAQGMAALGNVGK